MRFLTQPPHTYGELLNLAGHVQVVRAFIDYRVKSEHRREPHKGWMWVI